MPWPVLSWPSSKIVMCCFYSLILIGCQVLCCVIEWKGYLGKLDMWIMKFSHWNLNILYHPLTFLLGWVSNESPNAALFPIRLPRFCDRIIHAVFLYACHNVCQPSHLCAHWSCIQHLCYLFLKVNFHYMRCEISLRVVTMMVTILVGWGWVI